jgi:hypothetical protein
MADPHDDPSDETPLNERIVDLLFYVPAGLAVSVVEELPKLAARGRDRWGVKVSSARAVGQFVVRAGSDELRRRSAGLFHGPAEPPATARSGPTRMVSVVSPPEPGGGTRGGPTGTAPGGAGVDGRSGHVPTVSSLSIPGFDTLSASQVVQRLDGLNRAELVSVRAYEASNRGRRTILSRVDQLLDERS